AHGDRAWAVRGFAEPGADAAAHAATVAAPARHRDQRAPHLAHPRDPARPSAAPSVRDLHKLSRGETAAGDDASRAPGDLYAGRLRRRRALRHRAHGAWLQYTRGRHLGGERLAAQHLAVGG